MNARIHPLLRTPGQPAKVANIELFFDLVYVFAVTQLSQLRVQNKLSSACNITPNIFEEGKWTGSRNLELGRPSLQHLDVVRQQVGQPIVQDRSPVDTLD